MDRDWSADGIRAAGKRRAPSDFWDWAWSNASEELRGQFNYDIAQNVASEDIARMARRRPGLAKRYVKHLEDNPKSPYDLDSDPDGGS